VITRHGQKVCEYYFHHDKAGHFIVIQDPRSCLFAGSLCQICYPPLARPVLLKLWCGQPEADVRQTIASRYCTGLY
jgi:hypothetical protein